MKPQRLVARAWRRQWRWLALGVGLMLASATAALVLLGLSGWLITASALTGLGVIAALDIFTPGGGIRLAAVTRTLARYGERLATHRATLALLATLRLELMRRLLRLDEVQLRRMQRGDTLNRLTRDVDALDHLYAGVVGPLLTASVTTLGTAAAFLVLASPQAALVMMALGLGATAVTMLAGRAGRAPGRALSLGEPELRRRCTESLEGLKSLLAEGRSGDFEDRIGRLSAARLAQQRRLDRIDAVGRGLINAAGFTAAWAMLLVVLDGGSPQPVAGPVAVMAIIVMLGMNEIWQALPAAWRQLTQSRLAAERVEELANRKPAAASGHGNPPPSGPAAIRLQGVSFSWPGSPNRVLDKLDLESGPGERLLVTGPSGSGKTTLALLIMRQIEPDSGVVRLGGFDLRQLDPDGLRKTIGYLPQQPMVFADTLAANLRVAAPAADEAAMAQALTDAGLGDWLAGLEDGLDTWLDEGGASLSGGELRRVGLARLMLIDPPVVILDEPTTGLDPATARSLSNRLESWLAGRTTVMVSHEPELLPSYDRVLAL
ncbi:thiol reductant ABC exporter subunit CydC [Wenzhouxiangella sediminis]|uniref:thiol reductant ABC exporter subunit CydC n=1 Tax=Wenzhouxiangella sediminis TaxID=1792836 RepID=UPI0015F26C1D|nr:thiol reductant ABC exporter subunit CydC [Wenzhouxiangella sediminis]